MNTTLLCRVISRLGFAPLTKGEESYIREAIGLAIGQWLKDEGDYQHDARLNVKDVQRSLLEVATGLQHVEKILSAADTGIHHIHDFEVASKIIEALSENPELGSMESARIFVAEFRGRAETIVHGANLAGTLLRSIPKGRPGRIQHAWHDSFTEVLQYVCERNSVPILLSTNRVTGQPTGRFFEAAAAFEKLLNPKMRAVSPIALLRRLDRSCKRIKAARRAS